MTPAAHDPAFAAWARVLIRRSAQRADRILVDSVFTRDRLVEHFHVPGERMLVAYPGLDHMRGSTPEAPDPELPEHYALFVGQTEPHKNVGLLIEAWRDDVPADLHLVIAGPVGRDHQSLEASARGELAKRVHFLGRVEDGGLAQLYRDARCFLFPSRLEGFGLPPLEAMSWGVPTAVARCASLPEVTVNGAIHFDPDDAAALAVIVRRLADEPVLRGELGQRGKAVAARYTWAGTARAAWSAVRDAQRRS